MILLLTGCAAPRGDAIVFAVANAPTVLDPRLATDAASERVNALLYAQLVTLDEAGQPQDFAPPQRKADIAEDCGGGILLVAAP